MTKIEINTEWLISTILLGMSIRFLRELDKELILIIIALPLFKTIYEFLFWFPRFWKTPKLNNESDIQFLIIDDHKISRPKVEKIDICLTNNLTNAEIIATHPDITEKDINILKKEWEITE